MSNPYDKTSGEEQTPDIEEQAPEVVAHDANEEELPSLCKPDYISGIMMVEE